MHLSGIKNPYSIIFKGLPDKPTIQKEEEEVDVEFTLTWSASNTNCTDVSPEYHLEWRKKPLTGASKLCQQGNADETHFKITNLEYNSEYEVKLFAFNRHGESEPEVSTFKTKTGVYLINFIGFNICHFISELFGYCNTWMLSNGNHVICLKKMPTWLLHTERTEFCGFFVFKWAFGESKQHKMVKNLNEW